MTVIKAQKSADKKNHSRLNSENRILNAAQKLFAEKGYSATTTKEIALLADCSETLIFKYFNDKNHLYQYILINFYKISTDSLKELNKYESTSLYDEIHYIFKWFIHTYNSRIELTKMAIGLRLFTHNESEELNSEKNNYLNKRMEMLTNRLRQYYNSNQIDKKYNLEQIVGLIGNYIRVQYVMEESITKVEQLAEVITKGLQPNNIN